MPALFIGHGSPMNAIENNSYTQMLSHLATTFTIPKAILVISAHWMTEGTWVLAMEKPKTIHDFYGFPKALFDIQYPTPGCPELALLIQQTITQPKINLDHHQWGLDHGTWSILRHMYPKADVPVLQLSLDLSCPADYHYQLGQQLSFLRERGVLILASGNLIHNLRQIDWNTHAKPYDWAIEYDAWLKAKLQARDLSALIHDFHHSHAAKLSVPTLEHFVPLFYILGASGPTDELSFEFDEIQHASISMTSFSFV